MAKIASIYIFFILDVLEDLEVYQMNIKTSFLNREFKEEIYIWTNQKTIH